MNCFNYINARDSLIKDFSLDFDYGKHESLNSQFNIVSASLLNFLPDIDFSSHIAIYKNILLHKKLSILEQSSYEVLDFVKTENFEGGIVKQLKKGACIICTFHTGSYRIINLLLARYQLPFALVAGKDVTEKEGIRFSTLYRNLQGSDTKSNLTIINAESAGAGLQMLRELKRGKSLVLYIDGNSGSGAKTAENENSCAINFLQQQLFARKGICYLAHVAGAPILTMASYRKSWDEIRLRFFDVIFPDKNKDRNQFAIETTQQIYNLAAPLIASYPDQWEAWLYLYKVAHIVNAGNYFPKTALGSIPAKKIYFNSQLFGIFKLHNIPFLLKKNTYSFYEVDNNVYDLLTKCVDQPLTRDCFDDNVFHQLYKEGVLIST